MAGTWAGLYQPNYERKVGKLIITYLPEKGKEKQRKMKKNVYVGLLFAMTLGGTVLGVKAENVEKMRERRERSKTGCGQLQ